MDHAAPLSKTVPGPVPSSQAILPQAATLTLLVVVPDDADPAPWVQARAALPDVECSVILAYGRYGGARERDPAFEAVYASCGSSIFHLWEAAIRRATGTYLAVLDARCPPTTAWFDGVRRAIADGVPAFFGPVTFRKGGNGQSIVEYLLEYGQFARPIGEGMDEVPGNNLVFRRDLLKEGDLREHQFHKVFFVGRLKQQGHAPVYRDNVEVIYGKRYGRLHYLRRRFAHGRTYAALRSAGQGAGYRFWRAVSSPGLPLLRLFRIANSLRGKPSLQAALLWHPVYALAAEIAWSLGECTGYLTGKPGDLAYLN